MLETDIMHPKTTFMNIIFSLKKSVSDKNTVMISLGLLENDPFVET